MTDANRVNNISPYVVDRFVVFEFTSIRGDSIRAPKKLFVTR